MSADRIEAVATTGEEHYRMMVNRPFYYGYPMRGKTVYSYTREEWGIGASSGGGDHNLIRSFYFSLALTVLLTPVALGCLLFGVLALFEMPVMALVMVLFGALFGFGVLQCCFNVKEEWRGRKARKLKGLPKPWWKAADDHAYEWFLKHPSPHIPVTLEYFPESRILRKQAAI
ncbi:hypothetical protein [Pseudarthrobacter sulfonivorans]|uniref:hypothetical protein n=1 Tax=Pseudarthrobacter sulfonivorans TaxID=121292 RepID=UPI0028597A99|nr:hypothetical protein [Pseudarthrobacter sulfonivorans]MDR6414099.1 hypothetical protein [Pseudarthrobacter sulfonivorans]